MLWTRLRLLIGATLAVGTVFLTTSAYVSGFQEPAADGGHDASKPSTATPQPKVPHKAAELPTQNALQVDLRAQQLAARKAKAVLDIARATRELAEIAVEEYREMDYPRELAAVRAELKLAEADRARAADRMERTKRDFDKGFVSERQYIADKVAHQQKVFALEQAQTKKIVLEKFTMGKTIKELESDVEKARSNEAAKYAAWQAQWRRATKLELQQSHQKVK